jgi:hypothetical protein
MTVREIYRAEQLPTFQNRTFRTRDEARNCDNGDVVLVRDQKTGLIFNQAFQPELMRYDADYQNEQAVSSVFRTHLEEVSGIIQRHFHGQELIEVGCGKAYFIEHLHALNFRITGLDPTYEGNSPYVIKTNFSPEIGLSADGVILRHVLEHVRNPVEFLQQVQTSNGGGGWIYIEVPCFDWIFEHRAWFDFFYEHVNYFRIDDFHRIFGKVHDSGHISGGQYLYVVADLALVCIPFMEAVAEFSFPADLLSSATQYSDLIKSSNKQKRQDLILWGGASQGVIFALFMERAGANINYVVDINPAKQGRFLPATGLKVFSPEEALAKVEPGATIFIMNGNYLPEIRNSTQNQFN